MMAKMKWPQRTGSRDQFPQGLISPEQFAHFVRREKTRTDRTHIPFSVISLNADFRTPRGRNLFEQVVEFSKRRLRISDDLALSGDGTLSILLPNADVVGAAAVANDFTERFGTRLDMTVQTYPNDWYEVDGDDWRRSSDETATIDAEQLVARDFMVRRMPVWKRCMDVVGASAGLVLFSPLLLVIAVLVKTTSPGPVFYRQQRSGLAGVPFWIFKFRSMDANADSAKSALAAQNEQDGPAFKIKDDPRITPVGRFLRRTSLDELPQLWNVLKGNMTIVGPRPLPVEETAGCEAWHLERLQVTPGLTCIWQVHGRSRVTFDEWMRMDLEYLRDITIERDLKLIGQTAWAVVFKKDGM